MDVLSGIPLNNDQAIIPEKQNKGKGKPNEAHLSFEACVTISYIRANRIMLRVRRQIVVLRTVSAE